MIIGLVENNKYLASYLLSYAQINKYLSKLIFLKEFISNELNKILIFGVRIIQILI